MKLNFPIPTDGKMHRFCRECLHEGGGRELRNGERVYPCPNCGYVGKRTIYFDKHKVWVDESKELWHESVGVFVRNQAGKYLFFLRNEFPRKLAIPAGHLDRDKEPAAMAAIELEEETGLKRNNMPLLLSVDIAGDSCSAGADIHRWNVYGTAMNDAEIIVLGNESAHEPVWLTPTEALESDLVPPVRFLLEDHSDMLDKF